MTPPSVPRVSEMLARLGDKWTVLVIMMLGDGPQRFSDLKRMVVGVSQRMLTLTLRALERDGIVERTVHPTVPPRVEYAPTDLGRSSLAVPVKALAAGLRQSRGHPVRPRPFRRTQCRGRTKTDQAGLMADFAAVTRP